MTGVGGLNHFLLPSSDAHDLAQGGDEAMRFGDYAMEQLLNSIYRKGGMRGASSSRSSAGPGCSAVIRC